MLQQGIQSDEDAKICIKSKCVEALFYVYGKVRVQEKIRVNITFSCYCFFFFVFSIFNFISRNVCH